ncbi:sulfotransferase [Vibrio ouci]|uniref:Sulfotransferase n=1 Tax=Vibrio ouci TaxID=2499078 RepID=A0A4Y8WJU0_9VIBR|nr:sulfotransferase [Vibrio ouci]TFH92885.1 sulfotransferase [Vibrio ouci]
MKRLEKPIIVIGPGRTGSTIISEIVFAHHELGGPTNYSEWQPKLPWLSALTRLSNNDLWWISGEKAQQQKTRFLNNYVPRPAEAWSLWQNMTRSDIDFSRDFLLYKRASETEKQTIRHTFDAMLKLQGKQRLALKLTGPARLEYLHSIFPDAYFINIVREPTATVTSLLNTPFWQQQGAKQLWWHGAYSKKELNTYNAIARNPVAGTAFQLNKILTTTKEEQARVKANMLTIHYEQFLSNPKYAIHSIMSFCHLSNDQRIDQKLEQTGFSNRQLTNQLESTSRETIERWCPAKLAC